MSKRTTSLLLLAFLCSPTVSRAADLPPSAISFRYAPPEWQTSICLPDDPEKTLVDRAGGLLYHYGQGKREFGTRISVEVVEGARWVKQELYSPRVPIVRTEYAAPGLAILEEAFAVTDFGAVPDPTKDSVSATAAAPPRNDLVLVHVTNRGQESRVLHPWLIVDTVLPFDLTAMQVRGREIIHSSLRLKPVAGDRQSLRKIALDDLEIGPGKTASFFVLYCGGGSIRPEPSTHEQARSCRERAIAFWEAARLPYDRIQVPDAGVQALVDSSIRNIWQAREIKKGLPAFQVGPTCYRGLWIVDGAFLLESAALLGAGQEARSGVAYELTFQQPDGRIQVMQNYSKENGIVLWTCVRHAQLTQDKAWLESLWPRLERIAGYIQSLRRETLTNASLRDDGLLPAGFPDGGIGGVIDEYTNPYWNMAGLHAFIQGARWLGKTNAAVAWQVEYDDFLSAFRRAAARDGKTDAAGHVYLPIRMDGQDTPQRGQWAFCHAVYPGQIFAQDDPLVAGTLAMLEATEREGMVYGTGWDSAGIWNYFASFYGHAWLWQGNGRKAAQVLSAFGNHAAPTLVWREEQSLVGEKFKKVGDMPHNWASAEFIRLVVHLLALDRGDELHLLEGLPPEWTAPGLTTKLDGVATPFGSLHMTLQVEPDGGGASLAVEPLASNCRAIIVHLPSGGVQRLNAQSGGRIRFRL